MSHRNSSVNSILAFTCMFLYFSCSVNDKRPVLRYRVMGESMTNTLQVGKVYEFEQSSTYNRNDIVAVKHDDLLTAKPTQSVFRIMGMAGDTVEFKKGVPYLNGNRFNLPASAKRLYMCRYCSIDNLYNIIGPADVVIKSKDSVVINVDESQFMLLSKNHDQDFQPVYVSPSIVDKVIKFSTRWNIDHFGPLVIPNHSRKIIKEHVATYGTPMVPSDSLYFVIGDNVQQVFDSRIIGFIPKSRIIGKLVRR